MRDLTDNPIIPQELKQQVGLDNITFVSNDRLLEVLSATTAAPHQVAEALSINTMARLRSLKMCLFATADRDFPGWRTTEHRWDASF